MENTEVTIRLKNNKGETSILKLSKKDKVLVIKKEAAVKSNIPPANLNTIKLIYRGKLLVDEKTLEEYDIKDDSIIMYMISNKSERETKDEEDYAKHKADVDEIEKLGYSREDALTNLRATNWNVNQALDRLEEADEEQHGHGDEEDGEEEFYDEEVPISPELQHAIDSFMNDERFKEIRQKIRENPTEVNNYLNQLSTVAPELHQQFTSSPELVDQVLEEILEGSGAGAVIGGDDGNDDWIDDDQLANIPPVELSNLLNNPQVQQNLQNAQLTADDEKNILYLMGLGAFTREQAIQAYIACEKNVEFAANLLLDGN